MNDLKEFDLESMGIALAIADYSGSESTKTDLAEFQLSLYAKMKTYVEKCGMKPGDRATSGETAMRNGWPYGVTYNEDGTVFVDGKAGTPDSNLMEQLGFDIDYCIREHNIIVIVEK